MINNKPPILAIGKKIVVYALPHQTKLIEKAKKMEMEIKISGCPDKDLDSLNRFVHSLEMKNVIEKVIKNILSTLGKDDLSQTHRDHLLEIFNILYIDYKKA